MKQFGIAIENWPAARKNEVRHWLGLNFGPEGQRWGTAYDYGLDNIYMDEDIHTWYRLRWQ